MLMDKAWQQINLLRGQIVDYASMGIDVSKFQRKLEKALRECINDVKPPEMTKLETLLKKDDEDARSKR